MKYIKDNMPKDMNMDTSQLQKELDILDLAKRVSNFEAKRADIEVRFTESQSLVGLESAPALPFLVSVKVQKILQNELKQFDEFLQAYEKMMEYMSNKPKITQIKPLLEKLQKLKIRSMLQTDMEAMVNDNEFECDIWETINDLQGRMDDDNAEVPDEAFDYKLLKRAVRVL